MNTKATERTSTKRKVASFRRFSKADQNRFVKSLKRYKRGSGDKFNIDDYKVADPEFVGWYIYTQNQLAEMSW